MSESINITFRKTSLDQVTCTRGYKFTKIKDSNTIKRRVLSELQEYVYTEKEYALIISDDVYLLSIDLKDPYAHPDIIINEIKNIIEDILDELCKTGVVERTSKKIGDFLFGKFKELFNYDQPPLPVPKMEEAVKYAEEYNELDTKLSKIEDESSVTEETETDGNINGGTIDKASTNYDSEGIGAINERVAINYLNKLEERQLT